MNINCIICSDLITPTSDVYSTNCGHMFHYVCLTQWIERSRTCPQCRCKATDKTIHKLYFNLSNTEGIVEDATTLQYKIDNLQFQIRLKQKDIENYKDKYKTTKMQNAGLRDEIKELENKEKISESAIHALKEQVSYFKAKSKEGDRLNDEIIRLKDKLKELEQVQVVINGSRDQVNDMLRHNRDPHSLTILVSTLKKELLEADRKQKLSSTNMKHVQNDLSRYRKDVVELKRENTKLRNDLESHKMCEEEKHSLKRTLSDVQCQLASKQTSPCISNSELQRVIAESPAPLSVKPRHITSPTVSEQVRNINESDSPYLSVKSSNVGLSCLINPYFTTNPISSSQKRTASDTSQMLTQLSTKFQETKVPPAKYSYDGLGGYTKDDKFPTPKPNTGIKRYKAATVVSLTKFRKLAPNKNLKDFFPSSDNV